MPTTLPPSSLNSLHTWRLQALNWILRGQFPFWLLAFFAGTWNAVLAWQSQTHTLSNALNIFSGTVGLYGIIFALMTGITFTQRLGYRLRIFIMLGIYYLLSIALFSLSALSGDARGFLFAFVVLTAVFLDKPWNLLSLAMALIAFAVMGALNVSGIISLPTHMRFNAADPSTWLSGWIVFAALSISTSLGITYLLRSFAATLDQANQSLQNERRSSNFLRLLSDVNQLIVREHHPIPLLERACQIILENGYSRVWIGLLEPDGNSLAPVALSHPSEPLPEFAMQAIRARSQALSPSTLAIPILRPQRDFGILVVEHPAREFNQSETTLLQELADDLAYALENIEAENQRRAIADTAAPLLTANDESEFWQATLQAVQTILRADRAAIYVYEYGTDRLTCPYSAGLSQEYIDEVNRRFHEIPGGRILLNPQPVPVNDTESNPLAAPLRPFLQREGIRAYAVFPLFSANKLLGAFVAYRNALRPFSQPDLEAGQTLAHLVAASLQNARLFTETRAKAAEQAALFIAAQEISASLLNPPALLETLAKQLAVTLDATSVYIGSFDESMEFLTIRAEYWSESALPSERKSDLERRYPLSGFPNLVQILKSNLSAVVHQDNVSMSDSEQREYQEYGVKSKLFVPLLTQGRLVGHAEIWESRRRREFTQHEIHLAQALSTHAASVIHAANLFAELEKRESHFRALIENAVDGIIILNEDASFRYLSPSADRILGYPAEELTGRIAFDFIHPEDQAGIMEAFLRGIEIPDIVMRIEFRVRHSDGRWIYMEALAHNMLHDLSVAGVVVNYRDTTERKLAELKIQEQAQELDQAYDSTLEGWARALELRDKDTEGHTRRVTDLAVQLARVMKFPEEQLIQMRRGAILHDIGKVAVPDKILHKTAALNPKEQSVMRQHPRYAYEMLYPIVYLRPALDIPYCHHEKWDGTGYPRGLKGEDIPLPARIFAIADVWDALTSDRPYRPAWKKGKAVRYITEQSGKHFDPQVVRAFVSLLKRDQIEKG